MDLRTLRSLLDSVARGAVSPEEAEGRLASLPYAAVEDATVDHHRELRCGFPEVVLCESKTPQQVRHIAEEILEHSDVLLGTRASAAHFQQVAQSASDARYFERARVLLVDRREEKPAVGGVVIVGAGTSDEGVVQEATITAETMGSRVTRVSDVGVAGVHRLLGKLEVLRSANVIVAVAGMEGALPSVIAGLVSCPVIAVPTSVGYGVHLDGLTPLFAMLDSCATGVGVVNIDNGFGAAALAHRINLLAGREEIQAAHDDGPAPDAGEETDEDARGV